MTRARRPSSSAGSGRAASRRPISDGRPRRRHAGSTGDVREKGQGSHRAGPSGQHREARAVRPRTDAGSDRPHESVTGAHRDVPVHPRRREAAPGDDRPRERPDQRQVERDRLQRGALDHPEGKDEAPAREWQPGIRIRDPATVRQRSSECLENAGSISASPADSAHVRSLMRILQQGLHVDRLIAALLPLLVEEGQAALG